MKKKKLSIVISLIGRIECEINYFGDTIESLKEIGDDNIEIIFVADGKQWSTLPSYQTLPLVLPNSRSITLDVELSLPSVLYNRGIEEATGDYIAFWNLHTEELYYRKNIFSKYMFGDKKHNEFLYIRSHLTEPVFPSGQNRYGFLQIKNFYSLDDVFINKKIFDKIGRFNTSPILQRGFDREFLLRASMYVDFTEIGTINVKQELEIPFRTRVRVPDDLIKRYIIRCCRPAFPRISCEEINQSFVNDLKEDDFERIKEYIKVEPLTHLEYHKKYKLIILGGWWEYHHNQICFFNYLENLAGRGFATYNTAFDHSATIEDIKGNDLVIFTRCRSDNMLKLIDYCNEHSIPTIYMIDDNWMSIAKDYPVQGEIFIPGNPNYDNFIEAIGKCKTTWLFSNKIMEDLDGYARTITKFRISIEPRMFEVRKKRERKDMLYVGFAGSLRFDDTAFRALARVANKYKNVCVILVGIISPEQEKLFRSDNVIKIGFMSYPAYSKRLSELSPDLLIAPLSPSRTSASKCYNKYVESAIVNAACLFSKVEPYTQVVKEGKNGFFVEDEEENTWFKKLEEIICNVSLLREVQKNAYEDVINNYTVQAVLPEFVEKIISIVERTNED